jgi:uncharacterized protein (TIGR02246 family)
MSASLPEAIATYIAASNAHDPAAVATCFASDAVVLDEGHERRGRAEIESWKAMVTAKYQPRMDFIDAADAGGKTVVRCKVSGTFPGSPVELKYAFALKGGKIARLEIVP